jgi:hypothetical protein
VILAAFHGQRAVDRNHAPGPVHEGGKCRLLNLPVVGASGGEEDDATHQQSLGIRKQRLDLGLQQVAGGGRSGRGYGRLTAMSHAARGNRASARTRIWGRLAVSYSFSARWPSGVPGSGFPGGVPWLKPGTCAHAVYHWRYVSRATAPAPMKVVASVASACW